MSRHRLMRALAEPPAPARRRGCCCFRIALRRSARRAAALPHTRISPASCIEHEDRLTLGRPCLHRTLQLHRGQRRHHARRGRADHQPRQHRHAQLAPRDAPARARVRRLARATRPGWVAGPVHIGAYSFIGPHALIEAGTRLGRGTLVRAGSVVRGEFPDFAVLDGRPAQVVGDSRQRDEALAAAPPRAARALRGLGRASADMTRDAPGAVGRRRKPAPAEMGARAGAAASSCGRRRAAVSCPASTRCCRAERRLALGTQPEARRRQRRAAAQAAAVCALAAPRAAGLGACALPHVARHAGLAGDHDCSARRARLVGSAWGSDVLRHAAAQRAAARAARPRAARLRADDQRFAAHGRAHARARCAAR